MTGLFSDRDSAERAFQSISDRGYTREDVNLVMSDETRKRHFPASAEGRETELGHKAAEGAGIGGAIGGSLGAIAAAIAAVGTTIALPGRSWPSRSRAIAARRRRRRPAPDGSAQTRRRPCHSSESCLRN